MECNEKMWERGQKLIPGRECIFARSFLHSILSTRESDLTAVVQFRVTLER